MNAKLCLWLTLVSWAHAVSAVAGSFFASPGGAPSGDGTILRPWDLATALQSNQDSLSKNYAVKPGDTILLRGGTYYGGFTSRLTGTAAAPITLKPYQGERPIIEARATNITGVDIYGSYTQYRGIEIWNSSKDRSYRAPGLMVFAPGTKLINLIVHDAGQGIGCWTDATPTEICGCLIYNNGYETPADPAKAHGIYAHSALPGHFIRDNIIFNGYGFGLHCYAEDPEPLQGLRIEGNVAFNAGVLNANPGYVHIPNYLIGGSGSSTAVKDLTFANNCGYHSAGYQDNIRLGYMNTANGNATVVSNYFGRGSASVRYWTNLTFTGNSFVGLSTFFSYDPGSVVGKYVWDNNQYSSAFLPPFQFKGTNYLNFTDWKTRSGFDASTSSTFTLGAPAGTRAFVRTNTYEPGRANIVIYNWNLLSNVDVDLSSVLTPGASYEVRNAQDFFGAIILNGVFDGQPLHLPMTGLSVAKPVGLAAAPAPTGPEFNVFIVLQTALSPLGPPGQLRVN